jgi:hypothetical protein
MANVYSTPIGVKFSRLTVISAPFKRDALDRWRVTCRCECGKLAEPRCTHLSIGRVRSCGCLKEDSGAILGKKNRTHGAAHGVEWKTYYSMRRRCLQKHHKSYSYYGGRGITVCERWLESFENFLADMGTRPPKHSLDRIDVDGNYEPTNCRWATAKQQANNRRNNIKR